GCHLRLIQSGHLASLAHTVRRSPRRCDRPAGDRSPGTFTGACMRDLLRLLGFARKYWFFLLLSVLLMACVGAAHGTFVLLMKPVFDRVLNPAASDAPVLLFTDPVFHHPLYLNNIVPGSLHNRSIWTMVAFAILAVFLT